MRNKAHSLKPEVWARMVQQDGCEVGGGGVVVSLLCSACSAIGRDASVEPFAGSAS